MATGWTGPTFEGRGQSRAGLTVGLTGSRSARELVQEKADPVAGESRPAHESRSKAPKWPFSARYRASSPIQALEAGPAHRLTVGLTAGRAHRPSPRTVQGSREHGSPSGSRAGPARSTRARLTGRSRRRADGHELDGLTVAAGSRGPRPVQGRAHGSRLTVQALEAGPAHGSPSRPPKHESRADGLTVGLEARGHGSRAHRRARPSSCRGPGSRSRAHGPVQGRAHELDGLTVGAHELDGPTFEGRGQSRAGLTIQAAAKGHWIERLGPRRRPSGPE